MKNRYGVEYNFEKVSDNTYTFKGDTAYCRCGGKDGQSEIDLSDLGFFDPSGGPFISEGYEIEGRPVKRIRADGDNIYFEVGL